MEIMAASTTTGIFTPAAAEKALSLASNQISNAAPIATAAVTLPNRRRRITPQAGHALEILGHAIEYLTDEYVHEGGLLSANDSRVKAVQLLMALNRKVYFECPEVPTIGERCRALLHLNEAWSGKPASRSQQTAGNPDKWTS
jgi:hypothetical protein